MNGLATIASIISLMTLAFLGAVPAGDITVRLEAVGEISVPQGLPISIRTTIRNSKPSSELVSLSFDLKKVGSDRPAIPFSRWIGSVAAGSVVKVRESVIPSQWFWERGKFKIVVRSDLSVPAFSFRVTRAPVLVPRFRDLTETAGLLSSHRVTNACEDYSAGAAWGDVEGDGDLDLYLPQQQGLAQLWINEAGLFADRATERGVDNGGSIGIAAVFADYDNDGDQDLYVVNNGPNRLYRNDGTGLFADVAPLAGVADDGPGASASWGDYDNDGRLDLYVANWGRHVVECYKITYADDRLYHNEGDGSFTDQTALLHATGTTRGLGYQAAWLDYDGDRDQDLYLANDFTGQTPHPNVFWRNDGAGPDGKWRFTNVSTESGTGLALNSMGIAIGDYDRDGDLDIALSNIEASALLRNNGNGTFSDVAAYARVGRPAQRVMERSITWGMGFLDFNNDGWEDLSVVGGSLGFEKTPEPQPDALFVNQGNGRFLDLSAPSGADSPEMGRGAAYADYDRDGRVDFYIVNRGGVPRLYHNETPRRGAHWLQVDTVGTLSNRDGCGALLLLKVDRKTRLIREVFCGSISLGSGSDPTVHFGLGAARRVPRVTILWPSGVNQVLRNVNVDQRITVTEPAG